MAKYKGKQKASVKKKQKAKSGSKQKYAGSIYEGFAEEEIRQLEQQLSIHKRDAKPICSKEEESYIVPCVPDIFLKIACTDDYAPHGARCDYYIYIFVEQITKDVSTISRIYQVVTNFIYPFIFRYAYLTYAKVYKLGLRIDCRTFLGAFLIPTQFRLLIKQSQKLRKFYHLMHLYTRTLVAFRNFRLLLLEAVYRREIKKIQISLGILPVRKLKVKHTKDHSGKLLRDYFMHSIYRQKVVVDRFIEIQNNRDIVMWGTAIETEKET